MRKSLTKPQGRITNEQMARIARMQRAVSVVDQRPLDEWMHNFSTDYHTEREIRIFEGIVDAYLRLTSHYRLSPNRKRSLYRALCRLSYAKDASVKDIPNRVLKSVYRESNSRFVIPKGGHIILGSAEEPVLIPHLYCEGLLPAVFESEELFEEYKALIERNPRWNFVTDQEPDSDNESHVVIAVYDDYAEVVRCRFTL